MEGRCRAGEASDMHRRDVRSYKMDGVVVGVNSRKGGTDGEGLCCTLPGRLASPCPAPQPWAYHEP